MRIAISAAIAVATFTVLSSASDSSAIEPVIHHATVLMARTIRPTTMLPVAIFVKGDMSGIQHVLVFRRRLAPPAE